MVIDVGGCVGTVGTGWIANVVITVVLPSANVCVIVTDEEDMLKPGVLVLITLDEAVVLPTRGKVVLFTLVGTGLKDVLSTLVIDGLKVAINGLKVVVSTLVTSAGVSAVVSTLVLSKGAGFFHVLDLLDSVDSLAHGCEPVSVVVMESLVLLLVVSI